MAAQQGLQAPLNKESAPAGRDFVQGQPTDFGHENLDEEAYNGKGFGAPVPTGTIAPDAGAGARTVGINLGRKSILLGLHQPLYKDIDTPPAKILKIFNVLAAFLLVIGGFHRFIASFSGSVVQPLCEMHRFATKFCPGGDQNNCFIDVQYNVTSREYFEVVNCEWLLTYVVAPNDGFPDLVVAVFIIFYGTVTLLDEVYENSVKHLMGHLSFMSTLWGRGLFYLFMSSVVMTHAHTLLMVCSSLVMALAFLYILLFFIVEYTSYGEFLGFRKAANSLHAPDVNGPVEGRL